ncbi:MAG: CheR family methyltransferase [Candidatus Eremiobacterota bacterium]
MTGVRTELVRFRELVARKLGLHVEDGRSGELGQLLTRRAQARGRTVGDYLLGLDSDGLTGETGELARELTVSETYFFRHNDQFRAFAEVALPDRLQRREAGQRVSILSAGCASGEEVYSLAVLVREAAPGREVHLCGIDVNPAVLDKARSGLYSPWALRETPEEVRRRWFRPEGRELRIRPELQADVRLEERNLALPDPGFWIPECFDVIFCRNVLMYFTPEQSAAAVARLAAGLAPGGYLFLGHAETLRGLSHDFHLLHTHETFYYQRKGRLEPSPSDPGPTPLAALVEQSEHWVDAIRRGSQRIRELTARAEGTARCRDRGADLTTARELLQQERFEEALAALPPGPGEDLDHLLLRAALLAQSGELSEAEEACHRLMRRDEFSAGAHYLLALCREGHGDLEGAAAHDHIAGYLDPGFAMPRLHLGLLARRSGDLETARREFSRALALLQGEEAARLLLFGGGFSRDALMALCRAELAACEGAR